MRDQETEKHYDEHAVLAFSRAMRDKLEQKRDEGRSGWWDKESCSINLLLSLLYEHFFKLQRGRPSQIDPHQLVDIANLSMMVWCRVMDERKPANVQTLLEQRDRAWSALRDAAEVFALFDDHEQMLVDWKNRNAQAIAEARGNDSE